MADSRGQQTAVIYLLMVLVLALMLTGVAASQTTTGSIYGTVTDSSGAVIADAAITARNIATGGIHTAKSNSSGDYVFPAVEPGDYSVDAQFKGFGTETQSGVHLDSNQNAHVSFALKLGSVNEAVVVSAATTLVDTRESQLGITVDQQRIRDLPTNGRNAYDLVQLVPGVTNYTTPIVTGNENGTTFSVNGNRPNQNSYYLDGAVDTNVFGSGGNLLPNPDALQEFRVLTSNFDAEYGRSPGGVVNAITLSGTNRFHGLAYDYLRNNVLNARNYFNTSVTPLKQNQFGGDFGGPIVKNKAFFFLSYQGLRVVTPLFISAGALATPTPAEAMGDFSSDPMKNWPKQGNNYYSCNGVMGVICPNLLDIVAQNALKTVPLEDPVTRISPQQSASNNTNADQGLARIDYQLSRSHQLSGTFFTSHGTTQTPNASSNQIYDYSGQTSYANQTNVVLGDTWTISVNKLNNFRVFYTLNHFNAAPTYSGNTLQDMGSTVVAGSGPPAQPNFQLTGYWTMGMTASGVDNWTQQAIGGEDTFNWDIGKHTIKLGGSFLWNEYAEHGSYYGQGMATFTGGVTGNALADFLLGKGATFRQNNGANHNMHNASPALFAQDDFRLTHKLTLDLGLRWEVFTPFVGQDNLGTFSAFKQSTRFPTAPLGLLSAGDPGVPDGIMSTDWHAFAPRVGFAYDMYGNGRTAVRGAYGVFYATRALGQITNLEQQPFMLDITVNGIPNLVTPYAPAPAPFPYVSGGQNPVFQSGASLVGIPADATFPYVQQYNLTVEQQLGSEWGLRVSYIGSLGRKFYIARDENAPVYVPGASATSGLNARRPYQPTPSTYTFGEIALNDDNGNSSYNALQTTLTRRFSHGFSFFGSYVWAKSIDVSSADPSNTTLTLVNENDPAMDKGVSNFDIAHRFVASYLWSLPAVNHLGFFGKQVLSGWQVNGITTISSGVPYTVTSGKDTNLDGTNNDRPNVVGNPNLGRGRSRASKVQEFFNVSAFAQLPANTPYGTASRNMLFGPAYINTDFSAFKKFKIREQGNLEFRAELFNLFNYVNLSVPTSTLTSAKVGVIGSTAGAARIVQFALRYSF